MTCSQSYSAPLSYGQTDDGVRSILCGEREYRRAEAGTNGRLAEKKLSHDIFRLELTSPLLSSPLLLFPFYNHHHPTDNEVTLQYTPTKPPNTIPLRRNHAAGYR